MNRHSPATGVDQHLWPDLDGFEIAGVLWVGSTGAGLSRLDRATGQFKTYHHNPADPSSLSNDSVNRLLVDRTGRMWVCNLEWP